MREKREAEVGPRACFQNRESRNEGGNVGTCQMIEGGISRRLNEADQLGIVLFELCHDDGKDTGRGERVRVSAVQWLTKRAARASAFVG